MSTLYLELKIATLLDQMEYVEQSNQLNIDETLRVLQIELVALGQELERLEA